MNHVKAHAFGPHLQLEEYRLDNGLRLYLLPDRSAPVISYHSWFDVGSRHEHEGKTGICHLFEHLMFNETENFGQGEFDRRLEGAGAESNAATFLDWTYYHEELPSEALDLVVRLESDRMQHLVLKSAQLESEREVVANERRETVDDDVDGSVSEVLYSTAFVRHGYRWPTIGSMADIMSLSLEDCHSFYRSYYAPNNATLVLVGDFDCAKTSEAIQAHYGDYPAAPIAPEPSRPEPRQTEERRLQTQQPTAQERIAVGYHSPAMADRDHAPMVLLNEILFGGAASRVHRRLVEEDEIASSVAGHVGNFRQPSLYEMHATAQGQVKAERLRDALDVVLEGFLRDGPRDGELRRARARVELELLRGSDSVSGKAEQLGFCALVLDDPCAMWSRLDAYRETSRDEVVRVAEAYLQPSNRTVVHVEAEHTGGA
jgi:zinc protease